MCVCGVCVVYSAHVYPTELEHSVMLCALQRCERVSFQKHSLNLVLPSGPIADRPHIPPVTPAQVWRLLRCTALSTLFRGAGSRQPFCPVALREEKPSTRSVSGSWVAQHSWNMEQ